MSEHFLAQLQQQFDHQSKTDILTSVREKSWTKFLNLGLPAKSQEDYRYISLKELYSASFESAGIHSLDKTMLEESILPECKHSHIVFVDGCFSPFLSDVTALASQAVLISMAEAIRSHANFLQNHFSRLLKEEKDPFSMVNLALHPEGVFFYLPPKLKTTTPVQCLYVTTGGAPKASYPRVHLVLGAHSEMKWIATYHQLHGEVSHLAMPTTEISLEEGAGLNFLNCLDAVPASWHFESMRATLKKNARLDSLSVTTGAKVVRQSYRVQLKGEYAQANLNGLWMLGKNRTSHIHATVEHEAPNTRSMQLFKGVLNDVSQSSFEGKILVRDVAQKTEAYQLNNNLILSQGAVANSKPNLEVFADDVKASHGATFSQLDEEQLFYLSTRGIENTAARRLLISGFCREMIGQIFYPSILKKMQRQIEINSGA